MNWFRNNPWLGRFFVVFGLATLLAVMFLWSAHSGFVEANAGLTESLDEYGRLERLNPFPSESNFEKMKVHLTNYQAMLEQMKGRLSRLMLPLPRMAPNEFQARLREVTLVAAERARANRVKLPDNFHLGFDEYAVRLPESDAAPLLGQELSQIALLMDYLIGARIDALTSLRRMQLPEGTGAPAATPSPTQGQTLSADENIDRNIVDLTFVAAPNAARKVLNEIASSSQQFYIIRALYVRNQQDKGPPREEIAKPQSHGSALHFIVGDEHVEVSARIEMLRFRF